MLCKGTVKHAVRVLNIIILLLLVNALTLPFMQNLAGIVIGIITGVMYIIINIMPSYGTRNYVSKRLKVCGDGAELLILFLCTVFLSCLWLVYLIISDNYSDRIHLIGNIFMLIILDVILFWNGMIRVYVTSLQLRMKWRVIGALCGMIPIVHLIILGYIINIVSKETVFENSKIIIDRGRHDQKLCQTKYPILLVHGVFFRDHKYLNYWGRIPGELIENGARIFYGNHQSAASVESCGKEIAVRISKILQETGAEKVNIIAHSKGGLDCRYAISKLGMGSAVASLTTINTPHRGCEFADYLLNKIPKAAQKTVESTYNVAAGKLGDPNPDFMSAVGNLTASFCVEFNSQVPDVPGVLYESVGSKLNHASNGQFPLNFSYELVNYFDGANDGLVSESSFPWGSDYEFLTVKGKRGISHGDMIDLNRENIEGFDVREFYVNLVSRLKQRGL